MKKELAIISVILLLFLSCGKSFAQQVVNNKSRPLNSVNSPSDSVKSDTANVIVNTPKKLNDYYSVPVPVEEKTDNKTEPVINNQRRKAGTPH